MTTETPEKLQPALLTIPQVCEYLNIKRATFYKINATGAFGLLPIRLGTCRKVLYSRTELDTYVKSGCPHRRQWQIMRGQNG
jgi:excisionase family DNA binding protein